MDEARTTDRQNDLIVQPLQMTAHSGNLERGYPREGRGESKLYIEVPAECRS